MKILSILCLAALLSGCADKGKWRIAPFLGKPPIPAVSLWIDSDPSASTNRDVDDVLAINMAGANLPIVGISTTHGNVDESATWQAVQKLSSQLNLDVPLYRGSREDGCKNPAVVGMAAALKKKPMIVLAIGALDNVAGLVTCHPNLLGRIERLVVVMGRRKGEVFQLNRASFLKWNLPDLNFERSVGAADVVFNAPIKITLIPFAAGNGVRFINEDIPAGKALLSRKRVDGWISLMTTIGSEGSFPAYDPTALGFVLWPKQFRCDSITTEIKRGANPVLNALQATKKTKREWCEPKNPMTIKASLLALLQK